MAPVYIKNGGGPLFQFRFQAIQSCHRLNYPLIKLLNDERQPFEAVEVRLELELEVESLIL